MNTPNLTPEVVARLQAVNSPTTYNYHTQNLSILREKLAHVRSMYRTLIYLLEERDYDVKLTSRINPAKSVTLNSGCSDGAEITESLIDAVSKMEDALVGEIIAHLAAMQDPNGDHHGDIYGDDAPARLEVLRLVLTPEEYAAIIAPPPMCGPETSTELGA